MYEFDLFELVSDEKLWEQIYGRTTNRDVWRSLDIIQDQVLFR